MCAEKEGYCPDGVTGSLKAIVAVSRMLASFKAKLSSLLRTQPLFLSQDRASCAEETRLDAADICASRSAGVRSLGCFVVTWCFDYYWFRVRVFGSQVSVSWRHSFHNVWPERGGPIVGGIQMGGREG